MNTSKMITWSVGLLLGIVLVSGLIIPVVNEAQSNTRTIAQNTGEIFSMSEDNAPELTITKAAGSADTYLNGKILKKTSGIIITANNFDLRSQSDGQLFLSDLVNGSWAQIFVETGFNLHVIDNVITWQIGTNAAVSLPVDGHFFYVDDAGDWGGYTQNVKVTTGKEAYLVYYPIYGGAAGGYWSPFAVYTLVDGEVKDTLVSPVLHTNSNTWIPASNPVLTINATEGKGYTEYAISTLSDDEHTARNGEYIAPIAYSYISSEDSTTIQLFGVIPLVAIIALVVFAAGSIYSRRA